MPPAKVFAVSALLDQRCTRLQNQFRFNADCSGFFDAARIPVVGERDAAE